MSKLPKDRARWAKAIGDLVTGTTKKDPTLSRKRAQAGSKGGFARATGLSKKKRQDIARKAARARWG